MRAALLAASALLLAALPVGAGDKAASAGGAGSARVLEHHGRRESGYGEHFYNVVGRLQNTTDHPLAYVKLRVEALDKRGKAVASTVTYNESAEVLTVPEAKPAELLAKGKVKPLAAGAEERFRASFLKDETPAFKDYRVTIVAAPGARAGRRRAARPADRSFTGFVRSQVLAKPGIVSRRRQGDPSLRDRGSG